MIPTQGIYLCSLCILYTWKVHRIFILNLFMVFHRKKDTVTIAAISIHSETLMSSDKLFKEGDITVNSSEEVRKSGWLYLDLFPGAQARSKGLCVSWSLLPYGRINPFLEVYVTKGVESNRSRSTGAFRGVNDGINCFACIVALMYRDSWCWHNWT